MVTLPLPNRICIVGLGVMGASLALALRERGYTGHLTGVSRTLATRDTALGRRMVDAATIDLAEGVRAAELVVLATPVRLLIEQIGQCATSCADEAIITDMGSTKAAIVTAMDALPERLCAVGGHPMCGKETAGIDAADAGLYVGAPWILTRSARSTDPAYAKVRALAEFVGARPRDLAVATHDPLLAYASHLPYALSVALVTATAGFGQANPAVWEIMAGGFRDTSRVAASDVTMWTDILLTNPGPVSDALDDAQRAIDTLRGLIERQDAAGLADFLARAASARRNRYSR
ncbi:MAG: prephenate dehydrogenase [Thermoflexales bacterium]|nr:prephenate dehydrogenase [Thermoflexales bacterium]